ncbi:ornithine carbamoyltransferase [Galactobacter valiniphilus]|uniref:Ornithine carbamoyltransferase n=1 Tax=Galactobacter valiniphilus TaxID=2676122 RepID=A0A399JAN7_9MICC|nr:ornithine carbamoyltransferase [Galactobacter valiniphilus]RII41092.1 ornithine carbamoyltransferase [Galactobacter valiniphilus]
MRHLLSLEDLSPSDIDEIFALADAYATGRGPALDGAAVMFFPPSSLRTRVSFERGAGLAGLQPIAFPPETLDKPEALEDVVGYLAQFASLAVVRHPDLEVLRGLAVAEALPVVNAMTNENHPCEVLSDLYALRATRSLEGLRVLFVGATGNIGRAWREGAAVSGIRLTQCAPAGLEMAGVRQNPVLDEAVLEADIIITDGPGRHAEALEPYRIEARHLEAAPAGVVLAPCPPFVRDREVSAEAIAHPAFAGYGFKRSLLPVQQAVMAWCLGA